MTFIDVQCSPDTRDQRENDAMNENRARSLTAILFGLFQDFQTFSRENSLHRLIDQLIRLVTQQEFRVRRDLADVQLISENESKRGRAR